MNDLPKLYFTMETYLFPLLEEELCELTAKMKEFLRIVEMIKSLSTNKLILIAPCAILSSRKNNGGKHGNDKAENMGNNG